MAKLIVTNDIKNMKTNLLIELNDGSQVEIDVDSLDLNKGLLNLEQTVIKATQNQPQ